jgi:hypothetical protein
VNRTSGDVSSSAFTSDKAVSKVDSIHLTARQ